MQLVQTDIQEIFELPVVLTMNEELYSSDFFVPVHTSARIGGVAEQFLGGLVHIHFYPHPCLHQLESGIHVTSGSLRKVV